MVKVLKEVHPADKPGARTAVGIVDGPGSGMRIDPGEVLFVANTSCSADLSDMTEREKAAVCISAGVPVDYLGEGKWQLRYACAIVETETELKVKVQS